MTKNIFFLGSPGVGKSTLAHGLVYGLSKEGLRVGFLEESAKYLTWRGHKEQLDNQLYVSGLFWEGIMSLQNKCDLLVCDSHPLVGMAYASGAYREGMNLFTLYQYIEHNSLCVIVEPTEDLIDDYDTAGRNEGYMGSMYIWEVIKNEVIPRLDSQYVLRVNRDTSLLDLVDKVLKHTS